MLAEAPEGDVVRGKVPEEDGRSVYGGGSEVKGLSGWLKRSVVRPERRPAQKDWHKR